MFWSDPWSTISWRDDPATERANTSPDAKRPGSMSRSSNHCSFLLPDKSSERARPPTGLPAHSQSSSREMWCRKMEPFQKSGSSQMRNYREDSLPWKRPCLLIPNVFIRELSTQAHQLVSTASKHCGAMQRTMLNGWRQETGLLVPGSAAF